MPVLPEVWTYNLGNGNVLETPNALASQIHQQKSTEESNAFWLHLLQLRDPPPSPPPSLNSVRSDPKAKQNSTEPHGFKTPLPQSEKLLQVTNLFTPKNPQHSSALGICGNTLRIRG